MFTILLMFLRYAVRTLSQLQLTKWIFVTNTIVMLTLLVIKIIVNHYYLQRFAVNITTEVLKLYRINYTAFLYICFTLVISISKDKQ